ncbi:MAG: ABC transporter permease [Trueperaceae bacterium]|nr:ABC transporter permease [Trueperaceae bacterium]
MRVIVTLTAALVSILIGTTIWSLLPTTKAFSWVELSSSDYLVGDLFPDDTPGRKLVPLIDFPEAIASLRSAVSGDYHVYAAIGQLGKRGRLENGESFPIFKEDYVSSEYFSARAVIIGHGRMFETGEAGVYVIGHALARRLFGDPASAVGQKLWLYPASAVDGPNREPSEIVGVLAPSPAQDPDNDPDEALVGSLEALTTLSGLYEVMPLHLYLVVGGTNQTETLSRIEAWSRGFFGRDGTIAQLNVLADHRALTIAETRPRIETRRKVLLLFGSALSISALLALYAHSYWYLLQRRQSLGVDKALGATRSRLVARLMLAQLPWGGLGSAFGVAGLWSLYDIIPGTFLTRPPSLVTLLAAGAPLTALLILSALVSVPLVHAPAMELIRGKIEGGRVRLLLILVYGGLAITIAGGLAATRVQDQVRAESEALASQFGLMYSVQAGNPFIDPRAERAFEAADFVAAFNDADTEAIALLPGVRATSLAQAMPRLELRSDNSSTSVLAVAADRAYVALMGLRVVEGDNSGCVLVPSVARDLGVRVGDAVSITGLTGPVMCQVSGLLETHNPLWSWLVTDLPDVITPPLDGIGLALPGNTATPFTSTRVLMRFDSETAEDAVKTWLASSHPGLRAEVVPTTPDVETLLVSLRLQAGLFSLMAGLAVVLCVWGIIGGFLALLDAKRFETALDRALGLSLDGITRRWWSQMVVYSSLSAILGVAGAHLTTRALFDALALDVPNLPRADHLPLDAGSILLVALLLAVLSAVLSLTGRRWVARRSALQLLKEGVA